MNDTSHTGHRCEIGAVDSRFPSFFQIRILSVEEDGRGDEKAQYFITCSELPMRTVNEMTPQRVRNLLVQKSKRNTMTGS